MNDEKYNPPANTKSGANDGIYEGGEPEPDHQEVTELLVDPDDDEEVDEKRFRVKYKQVDDWRVTSGNFFVAFWRGLLRKNDYQIIFSQLLSLVVLGIGAWLICKTTNSFIGITIIVPFVHY